MINRYFKTLSIIIAAIMILGCGNKSSSNSSPSVSIDTNKKKAPGRIEFTKELHNFGTLKEGETVAYSFQYKNGGSSPFRLTKVEPTCGCLTVQFSKEEIAPGSNSTIEVIFQTAGEWGNQVKTVEIETSGGETKTLTIGAFVENKNFNIDLNNLK